MNNKNKINIIGGGLAGCEAAYQISKLGIDVDLYEMRPDIKTEAHNTEYLAELVCSNSFRSDDKEYNAVGVLHEELRMSDSLIMKTADLNKLFKDSVCKILDSSISLSILILFLARPRRVELLTSRSVVWRSIQLSYGRFLFFNPLSSYL